MWYTKERVKNEKVKCFAIFIFMLRGKIGTFKPNPLSFCVLEETPLELLQYVNRV